MSRSIPHGIYVPIPTFFSAESTGIDTSSTSKHVLRLAEAGIHGVVTCGTYGEGVLTTAAERITLITTIRSAFDSNGFKDRRVFAGISDNSIHTAISNAIDAGKAGADAVLCVPPAYYEFMVDNEYLIEFYTQLADASPVPVMIYNYPAVTAGLDLSSEVMLKLAEHPNIIGAKYTCGNIGKLTRVVQATTAKNKQFLAFGGMTDFLVPTLAVGGAGAIAGPANIAPKQVLAVYNLFAQGKHLEAYKAQLTLAHLDNELMKLGIEGTKIYLQKLYKAPENIVKVRCPSKKFTKEQVEEMVTLGDKYLALESST